MKRKKFTPPDHFKGVTWLSKKAGSFSDVPQRTVQNWTEAGYIKPSSGETTGSGDRRRYDVMNCIQIAIIQSLRREKASLIDALTAKGRLITASTLSHAFGVAGVGGVNPHGVLSGGGVTGGSMEGCACERDGEHPT